MIKRLLDFLDKSPVNFLAVKNIVSELELNGFHRIDPSMPLPELKAGDKLYVASEDSRLPIKAST